MSADELAEKNLIPEVRVSSGIINIVEDNQHVVGNSSSGYLSEFFVNKYLTKEAIALMKDSETNRIDEKKQSGPTPADFGEHLPIPLDAICASVVVSDKTELDTDLDPIVEEILDNVLKGVEE